MGDGGRLEMVGDGRWEMGDGRWETWWWWVDGHVNWASHGLEKSVRSALLIHHAWRWVELP